jgi:hypothetical protein
MRKARKPRGLRPCAKSLIQSVREFLTPAVFKQVRNAAPRRKMPRWDIRPLLYVALVMTWCCGDSLPEKFEAARAFYVVSCPKRKRPGASFSGFEKALAKLSISVFRSLAAAIRARVQTLFGDRLLVCGFIPFGCDGTRQECPRSEELERRLGTFGKDGSAPMIWNTSIVHLTLGFPWCWRLGRGGKASERSHLIQMLPLLPKLALIITDAGYVGYDVAFALAAANVFFLIRMSSNATLYTLNHVRMDKFREGIVYYWPKTAQNEGKPPIRGRLIRVHSRKRKVDVWLLTNVEDRERLSVKMASRFYRWRWENEGFFRTYKRTLKNVKLNSRTLRLVHREAEATMIATQLLLCQGALAMPVATADESPVMCSPRKVLLEIRRDIPKPPPRTQPFSERIAQAQRERRARNTPKEKRKWPRRKPHKPPQPPIILKLTDEQKALVKKNLKPARIA